jgi:hypothetical protein
VPDALTAGMLFAGVPALREPVDDAEARLENEIAEKQRQLQQLQQRDKVSERLMDTEGEGQPKTDSNAVCSALAYRPGVPQSRAAASGVYHHAAHPQTCLLVNLPCCAVCLPSTFLLPWALFGHVPAGLLRGRCAEAGCEQQKGARSLT